MIRVPIITFIIFISHLAVSQDTLNINLVYKGFSKLIKSYPYEIDTFPQKKQINNSYLLKLDSIVKKNQNINLNSWVNNNDTIIAFNHPDLSRDYYFFIKTFSNKYLIGFPVKELNKLEMNSILLVSRDVFFLEFPVYSNKLDELSYFDFKNRISKIYCFDSNFNNNLTYNFINGTRCAL